MTTQSHGKLHTYLTLGCRCVECKHAHTQYYRDYRAKTIARAVAVQRGKWARIAESYGGVGGVIAARLRGGE